MCLPHLPGYAPRGTRDRAGQARLSLAELDQAMGVFIRQVYNARPHSETGVPPQQRWESGAFIPRTSIRLSLNDASSHAAAVGSRVASPIFPATAADSETMTEGELRLSYSGWQ